MAEVTVFITTVSIRAVTNIEFVFYSAGIAGNIVYSYWPNSTTKYIDIHQTTKYTKQNANNYLLAG